ncbi:hypothetical protein T05_15722 [Trichinella murrelli]|uniref:Uncharacterized protein n=1 Tax=Trichinella murrelli TaxID=144512 RepID=A0A0V0T1J1_9BILA|nr:hypothetical protein T05_15722 [Trichinella murrelli]
MAMYISSKLRITRTRKFLEFLYYKNEFQVQMLLGSRTLPGGYKS